MKYTDVYLAIETEEANLRITERVPSVRTRRDGDVIEYRTNSGLLLGTLSDAELPSGESGSKLRYRTAITSAPLSHGRTTARKLRDAVEEHVHTRRN